MKVRKIHCLRCKGNIDIKNFKMINGKISPNCDLCVKAVKQEKKGTENRDKINAKLVEQKKFASEKKKIAKKEADRNLKNFIKEKTVIYKKSAIPTQNFFADRIKELEGENSDELSEITLKLNQEIYKSIYC